MDIENYISVALQDEMNKQIAKYTSKDAVVRNLNDRLNAALYTAERQAEKIVALRNMVRELEATVASYKNATIKFRAEFSEQQKRELSTEVAKHLIVELSEKKKQKTGRKKR